MNILVFDLASLQYQWSDKAHRYLTLRDGNENILTVLDCPVGAERHENAFQACEQALACSQVNVTIDGEQTKASIGFYNPYTGETAVGESACGFVFETGRLLIPKTGRLMQLNDGVLRDGTNQYRETKTSYQAMRRTHNLQQ